MKKVLTALLISSLASSKAIAQETQQCDTQKITGHTSKICLHDPGLFHHWTFSLVVDGQLILNIVDDFAENIKLMHTIPPGPALELRLSQGKSGKVALVGGCVPESKKEREIARVCNFSWGNVKIIDNARFVHNLRYESE